MKKVLFFIPAMLSIVFYASASLLGLALSPMAYLWIAAYLSGGVLLAKGVFWGGAVGLLPGLYLMYASTQEHGQVLPGELPVGIIIVAFYLLCGVLVRRRGNGKRAG